MDCEINWKERYIELEEQMLEMMKMTSGLIEKETNAVRNSEDLYKKTKEGPSISRLLYTNIDDILEIIVISKANNPFFLFELIDEETKNVIYQKSESQKNSCKFNVSGLSSYRIRVHVKNEEDEYYSNMKISKLINKKVRVKA